MPGLNPGWTVNKGVTKAVRAVYFETKRTTARKKELAKLYKDIWGIIGYLGHVAAAEDLSIMYNRTFIELACQLYYLHMRPKYNSDAAIERDLASRFYLTSPTVHILILRKEIQYLPWLLRTEALNRFGYSNPVGVADPNGLMERDAPAYLSLEPLLAGIQPLTVEAPNVEESKPKK